MESILAGLAVNGPSGITQAVTLWRLFYRRGDNPGHMFKEFYHPGDLGKVINRCKEHCTTMNYRFISVKPAIVDLAEEEKEHTNSY